MANALKKYLALQKAILQFDEDGNADIIEEIRCILDMLWNSDFMTKEERNAINNFGEFLGNNMEWIEINLPWFKRINLKQPDYPNNIIDQKVRDKFGYNIKDLWDEFWERMEERNVYDIESEVREEIENSFDYNVSSEKLDQLMKESTDPRMIACHELYAKEQEILDFIDTLPEYISWKEDRDRIKDQENELTKKASFCDSSLNKPGVLVEVKYKDGNTKMFLIGDINTLGGNTGDYFTAFDESDALVLRAMIMVSEEDFKKAKDI